MEIETANVQSRVKEIIKLSGVNTIPIFVYKEPNPNLYNQSFILEGYLTDLGKKISKLNVRMQ